MQYLSRFPLFAACRGFEKLLETKVQSNLGYLSRRLVRIGAGSGCKVGESVLKDVTELEVAYERSDAEQDAHERL